MKAIMLIAGKGTRLQPLTDFVPKCCLPIAGVPLLHIWFRTLEAAGIDELMLNPSHRLPEVRASVFAGSPRFPSIVLRNEIEPIGTAQTLLRFADKIDEDFLVVYGDVLTNINLKYLIKTHKNKKALVTMLAYDTPNPSQKGIISVDSKGWATDFQEKPEHPEGNLAFSGIFIAKPEFLSHIHSGNDMIPKDTDIGNHVFPRIIQHGQSFFVYHDPSVYIKDIGTISDYLSCQHEWCKLNKES